MFCIDMLEVSLKGVEDGEGASEVLKFSRIVSMLVELKVVSEVVVVLLVSSNNNCCFWILPSDSLSRELVLMKLESVSFVSKTSCSAD